VTPDFADLRAKIIGGKSPFQNFGLRVEPDRHIFVYYNFCLLGCHLLFVVNILGSGRVYFICFHYRDTLGAKIVLQADK
jgi:hypothetical protein